MNPYTGLVDSLRDVWLSGKTRPIEYRKVQLEALSCFIDERKADILRALHEDLRKPTFEAEICDLSYIKNEVNNTLNNLSWWMKDEYVSKSLAFKLDSAFIRKVPFGVVLIIGTCNFPIHLVLVPLVGAIAAGNCAIIKPSELSSHTERLLAEALPCYLDPDSPDFARLINEKHFRRLQALLDCGRVVVGGQTDESDFYIAPTVLADVKEWESIMEEEIFGPILPIITVEDMDAAIKFINRRERPLAVYAFSCDYKVVTRVLDCTSSGGFCGNDTLMHTILISLPFGGIGYSGMGKYHGKFSFDTFTHERGCLCRSMFMEKINRIRYPPYNNGKLGLILSFSSIKRKGLCTLL
uniref:Aldehyde dehydrogenase domain-containing protein n=1 Tax=Salvator merianae TaxID=96440 RepID=A0A8D0BVL2_SALMN